MKFIHEKYELIWWISTMLAFLFILIDRFKFRSGYLSFVVFVIFAVFMSTVGIINKKYKKSK
jgi:hypothetical protein